MKKILAGTTALVAAAVVAGQAQAADPIKLELGGFMTQWVGYVDNEELSGSTENYAEVYTAADTELYFRGSTKLDNGLTVSVNIDLEADRDGATDDDTANGGDGGDDTSNVDDVFMAISSDSLGKVEIGATKTVAYDMAITAPVGGIGLNDSTLSDFTNEDFLGTGTDDRLGTVGGDGQKINYYSPNLFGFQLGLTYGLETRANGGSLNTTVAAIDYETGAGLAYSAEFSGIGVAAAVTGSKEFTGGTGGAKDEMTLTYGGEISVAGFTVGGGFTRVTDFGQTTGTTFEGYDVGVAFATGPYTLSAGYLNFEDNNGVGAGTSTDEYEAIVAAVEYDLGAGITASASVYDAENSNLDAGAGQGREGFGIIGGISASF